MTCGHDDGWRDPAFSRPGPRLIDGVELLGHLLHPDLVDPPGNIGFAELRSPEIRASRTS